MVLHLIITGGNMQIKDTIFNLVIIAIILAFGYFMGYKNASNEYDKRIELYEQQLASYKDIVKNVVDIDGKNTTEVAYTNKTSAKDNDVEFNDNKDIRIKYNGEQIYIPNKVNEEYKFENGKLIVDRQEQYTLDLTANIDGLVEDRAKLYSRVGKADFGVLYASDGSDWYGGIRYNAKAYDFGYYHSINDNDWIVGVHYKF